MLVAWDGIEPPTQGFSTTIYSPNHSFFQAVLAWEEKWFDESEQRDKWKLC